MGYASSARRTWSASRSASLYTDTADIPRSRQARMTRTAISPRFATRTLRKGAVSSGPLACGPSRWPRVGVVPAPLLAVTPSGVAAEAPPHRLVEDVLLGDFPLRVVVSPVPDPPPRPGPPLSLSLPA